MLGIIKRVAIGGNFRRTLLRCFITVLFVVFLFRFVFAPLRLDGVSMEPNFKHGQFALANRLAYTSHGPNRGDVVALRMRKSGRSIFLLKRVVGLPGEWVGFKDGKLLVNGSVIEEDYVAPGSTWNKEPVLCEAEEYFVAGDNRSISIEQHALGRAPVSRIVGKVIF